MVSRILHVLVCPPELGEGKIQQVAAVTLDKPENATHWSRRRLASEMAVSHMTIHQVWGALDLKSYRLKPLSTVVISNWKPRLSTWWDCIFIPREYVGIECG
jgi:hypothetical protein